MYCVAGPTEQPALDAYVAAYKPTGVDACLQTLQQAANSKSVPAELVEGALVYLERNHKAGGAPESPCSSSTGPKSSSAPPPPLFGSMPHRVCNAACSDVCSTVQ